MSEAERRTRLAAAGHNPFRLPGAAVPFDLFSDVPHRVLVPGSHRHGSDADPDEVHAALAPLTGDARLALATKGRSAEIALVEALELEGPLVVLTHGLFSTTQAALARRGAILEDLPCAHPGGSGDVDVERLGERLGKGGVRLVYLELANNALFGWPLSAENIAAVRDACDRHGVMFIIDAARPLTNSCALEQADLVSSARHILALGHAFTISCAKELLVPTGSVIGSSDAALITRASQLLFKYGTSMSPIDPPQQRADLRDGARYSLARPQLVVDRLALVRRVAAELRARGVEIVEPVTAHAVYIPLDRALLPAGDLAAMLSLLGQLYVVAGIRGQIANTRRGPALRLAFQLCSSHDDAAVREVAAGVAGFLARVAERSALRMLDGQHEVAFFRTLAPASS
jgi:tryptophanase